ncbi:hypothetical protein [uncultured Sphingomonas sp.]|uniref:hypothetical protein n=1 Tax=uncultured Sphingomonas sp. TaxID=158754 RepID=UPI0025DEF788|nr:hypothetical protein [uncultured Sphingomonas sp.]
MDRPVADIVPRRIAAAIDGHIPRTISMQHGLDRGVCAIRITHDDSKVSCRQIGNAALDFWCQARDRDRSGNEYSFHVYLQVITTILTASIAGLVNRARQPAATEAPV